MPSLRLSFSGECRKPAQKTIGGKPCVEFQLMRKNYAAQGSEATFTWIRVTVFDAKPWQIEQCQEGRFVCGSGEFTLRSYEKDGAKRQSAEVRCSSFDLDGPHTSERAAPAASASPSPAPRVPAPATDDCPFARPLIAEVWG